MERWWHPEGSNLTDPAVPGRPDGGARNRRSVRYTFRTSRGEGRARAHASGHARRCSLASQTDSARDTHLVILNVCLPQRASRSAPLGEPQKPESTCEKKTGKRRQAN